MKVLITRQELVEVFKLDGLDEAPMANEDLEDFLDSFTDTILNGQDIEHQTDDDKFSWVPKEVNGLTITEVVDEPAETPDGQTEPKQQG